METPLPSPAHRRAEWPAFATTVAAAVAVTVTVACVQLGVVMGVPIRGSYLVVPVLLGTTVGSLVALLRRARARARLAVEALRSREAEVTRLAGELEQRVRARTAELERQSEALVRSQRLEVVGRLSGGVAHDFNNILTAMVGCASALRDEVAALPAGARERAEGILDELDGSAERAVQLTRQLVTLGRSTTLRIEAVDLAALATRMGPMLRRLLGESIELRLPPPGAPVRVRADRAQLEQLVLNLAVNGRDAMPRGGVLSIAVERTGTEAFLVVSDTGAGMDEATRAHMFEPFFTTKGPGRGTGLGLVVVAEVVRRASGRIDVQSRPGQGTRVCVTLPATDASPAPEVAVPAPAAPPRPLRVLLVEDDAAVRRRLSNALVAAGHRVHEAGEPLTAEQLAREHGAGLDAVVCDLVLPGASGLALMERLRAKGVAAPVVFVSGYSQEELEERVGALQGAVVLQKPFAPATLLQWLHEAAGGDRRASTRGVGSD